MARRKERRDELVKQTKLEHFANIEEFTDGTRDVMFIKLAQGGHDYVGTQEGLQDIIGTKYGFIRDRLMIEN